VSPAPSKTQLSMSVPEEVAQSDANTGQEGTLARATVEADL